MLLLQCTVHRQPGFVGMFVGPLNTAVRLVLSAALLASAGATPGIQHSHEGGNRPHHHTAKVEHSHSHSYHHHEHSHHEHSHVAAAPIREAAFEISNCFRHLHVFWLGMELTFPSPASPNDQNSASDGRTQFVATSLLGNSAVSQQTHRAPDALLTPIATHGPDSIVTVPISGRFSNTPAAVTPLCDTARHERSGVQLI
jgi:hypothetical protein